MDKDIEILVKKVNLANYLIKNNYAQKEDIINDIYCHILSKRLNKVNHTLVKNLLINKYFRKKELNKEDINDYEEFIEDTSNHDTDLQILAKDILNYIKPFDRLNIIYDYYYLGNTFKEIGIKHNVSKQFIEQEHKKLIKKIKKEYL